MVPTRFLSQQLSLPLTNMSDMKRKCAPPADYAFKEMAVFSDILLEAPWTRAQEAEAMALMRKKKESKMSPKKEAKEGESKTESSDQDEQTKASPPRKQVPVDEDPTLTRTSVKCNNNSFASWDGFSDAMDSCLSEPGQADFFDLSFNQLTTVDEQLGKYSNISVLYLHGNQIKKLKDLRVLKGLKNLRKLTLHGNPVENVKGYRMTVIAALPKLKQLDFTPITSNDRDLAETVGERKARQRAAWREKEGF